MKNLIFGVTLAVAVAAASPAMAGQLQLTMQSGRVTLIAQDVPVRQILQEWSKVGQTTIVNAEKVAGVPVTLQLVNVPEKEALDIVLRSVAGYMAAPRPVLMASASMYDRILIMPTSRAPAAAPPSAIAPPPFQQRAPMPVDDDDEPAPVNMPAPMQPNPGVVGAFPGPQAPGAQTPANGAQPAQNPMLSDRPGVPVGGQQTPNGAQQMSPYPMTPSVVKPVGPGGGGGEGGEGA